MQYINLTYKLCVYAGDIFAFVVESIEVDNIYINNSQMHVHVEICVLFGKLATALWKDTRHFRGKAQASKRVGLCKWSKRGVCVSCAASCVSANSQSVMSKSTTAR